MKRKASDHASSDNHRAHYHHHHRAAAEKDAWNAAHYRAMLAVENAERNLRRAASPAEQLAHALRHRRAVYELEKLRRMVR